LRESEIRLLVRLWSGRGLGPMSSNLSGGKHKFKRWEYEQVTWGFWAGLFTEKGQRCQKMQSFDILKCSETEEPMIDFKESEKLVEVPGSLIRMASHCEQLTWVGMSKSQWLRTIQCS
jgi:hypothetical protein